MKQIIYIFLLLVLASCNNKSNTYYYNLACDEEQKGNIQAAINNLNKALEINPTDLQALNNRGYDYLELKQYKRAENDFQKMIEIDNNCPAAYYGLGYVNYVLENYKKAIDNFDKTIAIKGGGPVYLEYVDNNLTKSEFSIDISIDKVLEYKNLSELKLKEKNKL